MVDAISIIERLEEYKAWAQEMHANMDVAPRGGLHFDGEKVCFKCEEDDLLDDKEEVCICMVDKIL